MKRLLTAMQRTGLLVLFRNKYYILRLLPPIDNYPAGPADSRFNAAGFIFIFQCARTFLSDKVRVLAKMLNLILGGTMTQ